MMDIEHAGDTVKTETVKLILIHPETKVAQQKPENLVVSVVEKSAIPLIVATLAAAMEVLVIGTIELIETVKNILRGMTVNDIEKNNNTHAVGCVNELLQILRGPISATGSEEIVHLISEAGIVRMLHDRHQLNHIVAEILDSRKHVLGELFVCSHSLFCSGNANMCLVYADAIGLLGPLILKLVFFRSRRIPETSIVGR